MTKRAISYARVSYDDRDTDGRNLSGQVEMCREYITRKSYAPIAELAEDARGASGAEIDLPQLNNLRDMAQAGEFDVLVVREIDRLSRNLAKQLIVEEELKRAGVTVEYVLGDYPDTPEGNFMKHVRASVAELEREKVRERTMRARDRKAKAGKWVGNGDTPYGYRRAGVRAEAVPAIDEAEAGTVRRIYQLYIGDLEQSPLGTPAIARLLSAECVPPPNRNGHHGAGWRQGTVYSILARRTYLGEFAYGEQVVRLPALAILDEFTWQEAQTRRKLNGVLSPRCKKYEYLMGGRICCACGVIMRGKGKTHRPKRHPENARTYLTYQCNAQETYRHLTTCCERPIKAGVVDALVWDWLKELITEPGRLEEGLNDLEQERRARVTPKQARLDLLDDMIAREEGKLKRLARDLSDLESESARQAIKGEMRNTSHTRDALDAERRKLNTELERTEFTPDQRATVQTNARAITRRLKAPTFGQKRELLDALDVQAIVEHDEHGRHLAVSCAIATWTGSLEIMATSRKSTGNCTDFSRR